MAARNTEMSARVGDAALELFSTRGYDGTSMRDIAKHIGISVANLYNYTDGKETLFWTIVNTTTQQLMEAQQDALGAQDCSAGRFSAFVQTHASYHTKRTREARLGYTPIESLSKGRARQVRASRDKYEGMLRALVDEGLEDGYFTTDQYLLAARAILQMGIGVSLWFRPSEQLASEEVGNIYAGFALSLVGFDADKHALKCQAPEQCAAALLSGLKIPTR